MADVFTTSETKITETPGSRVVPAAEPKTLPKTPTINLEDVFYEVAYNYGQNFKSNADKFLQDVKQMADPELLGFITLATKVLVASDNGIILMFDDEVDAELLNAKYNHYDFLKAINKYFQKPIYVLGFEKQKLIELTNDFKNKKKQGTTFEEPNIEPLRDVLKSNNAVAQAALELFGE
ncbi:DNA polymerase III subunits gamma and tau [Bacteroidales bacterium Barb6]|nr:DNA polymerase III subunits gamma and tau [Bacteroidales bacterium Barb6]